MNIIVWLLVGGRHPRPGSSTINQGDLSLTSIFVSLLGAIILLAIVRLVRGVATR